MSMRKTMDKDTPYATYKNSAGWTWLVLKVNQPSKTTNTPFVTWMVAAQSPATFGGWDMGDTYVADVLNYGTLVSATDEFKKYLRGEK